MSRFAWDDAHPPPTANVVVVLVIIVSVAFFFIFLLAVCQVLTFRPQSLLATNRQPSFLGRRW
jgi:hypothetical protein